MADSEEDWIKQRAYRMWEEEGYPTGKDSEHWDRARLEHAALKPDAKLPGASRQKIGAAKPVADKAGVTGNKPAGGKSPNGKSLDGKSSDNKSSGSASADKPGAVKSSETKSEKVAKNGGHKPSTPKASAAEASPTKTSSAVAAAGTVSNKRTKKTPTGK